MKWRAAEREDFQHDPKDDIHTMFEGPGQPTHQTSPGCWCAPTVDYVDEHTGIICWIHRVVH